MTRDEILEDFKLGDYVRLKEIDGGIYAGIIKDFGTTGLKLVIDGKGKRILYERIIEYDVDPVEAPEKLESGENDATFLPADFTVDSDEIMERNRKKLSPAEARAYVAEKNRIDYAKKIREFNADNEKIKKVFYNFGQLVRQNSAFHAFIGLLLLEFGDKRHAMDSFLDAGEYCAAFKCGFPFANPSDAQKIAILAVENGQADETICHWLCQRALATENVSLIGILAKNQIPGHEKALFCWAKAHKPAHSQNVPVSVTDGDVFARLKEQILAETRAPAKMPVATSSQKIETKSSVQEGHIISYLGEKRFGWIRPHDDSENVFFYINQIKDEELQRLLEEEEFRRYPVRYILGDNGHGRPAADAIELSLARAEELDNIVGEPRKGYLDLVNADYGKIYDQQNNTYSFLLKDITDPLLRADLEASHGLREFEVMFAIKEHKGKKVACNISGCKKYSESEIAHFIKMGFVNQRDIEKWRRGETKTRVFKAEPYMPLKPWQPPKPAQPEPAKILHEYASPLPKSAPPMTPSAEKISFGVWPSQRECISRAYELVTGMSPDNPFASLESIPPAKYYDKGHGYLVGYKNLAGDNVGRDLVKAEEMLIKAIQASDNVASAVADLVNVYLQQDHSSIIKGLHLIHEYGYMISPTEKLLNIYVSLVEKSGNDDARVYILMAAIRACTRVNTLFQYKSRLATVYSNRKMFQEALTQLVECKELIAKNKNLFPNQNEQNSQLLKRMAVIQWLQGNRDKARILATESRRYLPADETLDDIIKGNYDPNESSSLEAILDENSFMMMPDTGIAKFLVDRLQQIELSSILGRFKAVSEKIKDGKYSGTPEEATRSVRTINQDIFRDPRQSKGWGSEQRSMLLLAMARLISDASLGQEIPPASRTYIGRAARFLGDSWINKAINIDSVRFVYIQAINHMADWDNGNIAAAQNMLVATFFRPDNELPVELQILSRLPSEKSSILKEDYYRLPCKSVKDLLLATFMLKPARVTTSILESIFKNPPLREKIYEHLAQMSNGQKPQNTMFEFKAKWENARKQYDIYVSRLKQEIKSSVEEVGMAEGLQGHAQTLKRLAEQKLLWNLDERYLEDFARLLEKITGALECYKLDDKISRYREIAVDISTQQENIEQLPTALGYDNILTALGRIEIAARQQFDAVYQGSIPACSINLSHESVFVNGRITNIVIAIRNEDNKQTADGMEINLEFGAGVKLLERTTINSVRGGEEQELVAKVELTDEVLAAKQFDVTISISYKYMDGVDTKQNHGWEQTLTANLLDKENFVPLDNKYDMIIRGSGVDKHNRELFKGRDELIKSICDSLSGVNGIMTRNRGIVLWGQRRVGKNSVKDLLKDNIVSTYPKAYIIIELGSIGKGNTLDDFLQMIVDKTEWVLMQNHPELYEQLLEAGVNFNTGDIEGSKAMSAFSKFMDRFSSTLRSLSPPETNIPLYCIDEFSYLYERIETGEINGTQFMRFWKSFIQDYNICAIIIAQDNIPVWKSHYENEFACMNYDNEITYLDEKGATDLLQQPCSRVGTELFTQDAVNLIYKLTLGSAFLIVILCKHIIDYLNSHYFETVTRTIVRAVLEDGMLGEMTSIFNKGDFHPQILDTVYVGDKAEQIGKSNEKILREIAEKTIYSSQVDKKDLRFFDEEDPVYASEIFNRLKERNIIKVEYQGTHVFCSIFLPLLKLALLKESGKLTRDVIKFLIR